MFIFVCACLELLLLVMLLLFGFTFVWDGLVLFEIVTVRDFACVWLLESLQLREQKQTISNNSKR